MIRFSDSLLLATTKLRTRRIRTFITVLVSSVLFAGIVVSLILSSGAAGSLKKFNQQGLGGRYLVSASSDPSLAGGALNSREALQYATRDYQTLIQQKTADAKKLGVSYDPTTEPQSIIHSIVPGNLSSHDRLNINSLAAQQAIREYIESHPSPGLGELKNAARMYHPIAFYSTQTAAIPNGQIKIMANGKENLASDSNNSTSDDFFHDASLSIMSSHLTRSFVSNTTNISTHNVPIIVPYSDAAQFLNLKPLSKTANSRLLYQRISKLYKSVDSGKMTIETCYRNSVSVNQIDSVFAVQMPGDSTQPEVSYSLPNSSSCAPAKVASDIRSPAVKAHDIAEAQFSADFDGQPLHPQQQKITFQVVGLYSDLDPQNNLTFFGLLSNIAGASLANGYVIPDNLLNHVSSATKNILFSDNETQFGTIQPSYTVEFSNAHDAEQFIHDKSCTPREGGTCASPGRLFNINSYGNNSIALDGASVKVERWLYIGMTAVAVLAIVIMTTMVGRTIVDGRKESAVFRALGARRSDIAAIYSMYTLILTFYVLVVSFGLGLISAFIISQHFSISLTDEARLLFGAVDTNMKINLFSINIVQLAIVAGVIIVVGFISVIFPVMRNVPRSPIDDLCQE